MQTEKEEDEEEEEEAEAVVLFLFSGRDSRASAAVPVGAPPAAVMSWLNTYAGETHMERDLKEGGGTARDMGWNSR